MKRKRLIPIVLFIITSLLIGCLAGCSICSRNKRNEELLREAYIYTFPLVMENATLEKSTNTITPTDNQAPINQFIHSKKLADASSKIIVTPNVDTVYSQAFLDLGENNAFVLIKPKADRYLSIQILDGYTNTHALLGSGFDGQEEEKYLITRDTYTGDVPECLTHVTIDTDMAWILVRTICNGNDDLTNVYKVQEGMKLLPLENYISNEEYIPEKGEFSEDKNFVPVEHVLKMSPEEYFNKANNLLKDNPPAEEDKDVMDRISDIGVGPGLEFDTSVLGDNPEDVWAKLLKTAKEEVTDECDKFNILSDGWNYYGEPIGNFGTEYKFRAAVALKGLGANPVDVAIYARTSTDYDSHDLNGNNTYVIHFDKDKFPQVEKYGFWSITAYGEDDFLIKNTENKYAVNDRSDFKYNDDGSLDVYISSKKPENVDSNNYIPVNDEAFHLYFRIYLPSKSSNLDYLEFPMVKIIE